MTFHRTPIAIHCVATVAAAAMTWALFVAPAAHAQSPAAASGAIAERLHAEAVASFKRGRYPEAYGRFIRLADSGHAPSAAVAQFMYTQGPALFGRDWDISPDQLAAWSSLNPTLHAQAPARAQTALR